MKKTIIYILILLATNQFVFCQQLSVLIEEAIENNSLLKEAYKQTEIASEKVDEISSLPNTQFGVGYFVSEPETRTGPQRAKLSVMQMLPWFGTLKAKHNYANALVNAEKISYQIEKRKLVLDVSKTYYLLYSLSSKQDIVNEHIKLVDSYLQLALKAVEVNKATAVDVLRLQMQKNELEKKFKILEQDYIATQTKLNKLLNREKTIPIVITDSLIIPDKSALKDEDVLLLHPEIEKLNVMNEALQHLQKSNEKERYPQLGFGLDYVAVAKREGMNFSDNGKDIFMPMVTLSLPLFNKKYTSKNKQIALEQEQVTFSKQSVLNKLTVLLEEAVQNRESAKLEYATQQKNLAQANSAESILLKSYETGMFDFNDVLKIQELKLDIQLKQIDAINMYYNQEALIDYLTK